MKSLRWTSFPRKSALLNQQMSLIEDYLANKSLNFRAMLDKTDGYTGTDFIIATLTDYDLETNYFDTYSIKSVTNDVIAKNPQAVIIISGTD